ncbi:MAG: redoxin domain-containing protein [Pelagibacterales bacterium]|nr:redoxin domain-containing protein [Pelagibacterales bacterium]
MKISKKDQSFLLLIAAVFVVLYGIYSFFSFLFYTATFHSSAVSKIIISDSKSPQQEWLNTSRNLEVSDLKGRVILLNFWNYGCKKCENVFSEIDKLQKQYGNKLTVITIHCPKSEEEKENSVIKKEVLKNGIEHPVFNDKDGVIKNNFEIKQLPTLVLLDIRGDIVKTFENKEVFDEMNVSVKKTVKKYQYEINHDSLPISLEKYNIFNNVLNFPTKLEYAPRFKYNGYDAPAIFITNFADSNIVVTSLVGEIITTIGQKGKGFADGDFNEAAFNFPQGLIFNNEKLYVADTGNHTLREVNFSTGKVTTLVGSGVFGNKISSSPVDVENVNLNSPNDLEFLSDKNYIVIANSGTSQILKYDIKNKKISSFSDQNSELLSGISDLSYYGKILYAVNPEKSTLFMINASGSVEVLADKNSNNGLKRPTALTVDDTGIYVIDAAENRIKEYDFGTKKLTNFIGSGKKGDNLGRSSNTEIDEPSSIVAALDRFYIADTNNNRILSVSRASLNSELLDILPPLKTPKRTNLEYLPNLEREKEVEVISDKELKVKIDLKNGWKINEMGPSFLTLLKLNSENEADLIMDFDWNVIQKKSLTLPKLIDGENYLLQGVIYYCEDKQNALCYVKSYEQRLEADSGSDLSEIEVKLGH